MAVVLLLRDPIDLIHIFMEPVPTDLILDPQQDQDTAENSQRQACDIYEGIGFVPFDIPPGDLKVVPEHYHAPKERKRDG